MNTQLLATSAFQKLNITLKIFLFLLSFTLMAGCGKKVDENIEIPKEILSKQEFADLLIRFALAESAANTNINNITSQKTDSAYAFDPLKEKGISKGRYDSTLRFYSSHPEIYKTIYDTVLVMLSEMKALRNATVKDSTSK